MNSNTLPSIKHRISTVLSLPSFLRAAKFLEKKKNIFTSSKPSKIRADGFACEDPLHDGNMSGTKLLPVFVVTKALPPIESTVDSFTDLVTLTV